MDRGLSRIYLLDLYAVDLRIANGHVHYHNA